MIKKLYSLLFFIGFAIMSIAQPEINLELYSEGPTGGFTKPTTITNAGDDRLFVLDQPGQVYVIDEDGNTIDTPFLDIEDQVGSQGNEQGLLGLAFHPNYSENGEFYLNYTDTEGSTIVSRWSVSESDPNQADAESEEVLLTVPQPFGNHNGGHIEFGPDGYLYIGMGDGGSGGDPQDNAQDPLTLLGKMLRIDVDNGDPYAIPEDNPFAGDDFTLDEIWALGLRNPWRYSFDSETGDLWIGDVGQDELEEVDFQPASSDGGENYGWRCYEASQEYNTDGCSGQSAYVFPVHELSHDDGNCSITGGRVYRGNVFPELQGHYIFVDYCAGNLFSLTGSEGNFQFNDLGVNAGFGVVAFGEDVNNEMYLTSQGDNQVYRITGACSELEPEISSNGTELSVEVSADSYQWYLDGNEIEGATSSSYTATEEGSYTVNITSGECEVGSTPFILESLGLNAPDLPRWNAFPNPASDLISFEIGTDQVNGVRIYDNSGRLIESVRIAAENRWNFEVSEIPGGIYQAVFTEDGEPVGYSRISVIH